MHGAGYLLGQTLSCGESCGQGGDGNKGAGAVAEREFGTASGGTTGPRDFGATEAMCTGNGAMRDLYTIDFTCDLSGYFIENKQVDVKLSYSIPGYGWVVFYLLNSQDLGSLEM